MTILQSVLLGILQGIAEFLPISSSGHLAVAQKLFGLEEVPLLYDVMLHLATLLAVCIFFRKKIWALCLVLFRWIFRKPAPEDKPLENCLCNTEENGRKTIIAVFCATFVTGIMGVCSSKLIPDLPVQFVCAGFLATAALLVLSAAWEAVKSRKQSETMPSDKNACPKGISILQSLFIGFMQGIGTLPGISRSGTTITGAQLSGVEREAAGEFSFIVSIPAILGAFILEAKDLDEIAGQNIGAVPVIAGCVAAFLAGWISLVFLMKLIKKGRLVWFAVYLVPVAVAGLIYF